MSHNYMKDLTKKQNALLEAAKNIQLDPRLSFDDSSFLSPELIQVTLPHRQPNKDEYGMQPKVWTRKSGFLTLTIKPRVSVDLRTGEAKTLPYPSGSIPRLLLLWLNSEVVKQKKGGR